MSKLRVADYCRVSTNREEPQSNETQIFYCGKLIEHKYWRPVNTSISFWGDVTLTFPKKYAIIYV